VVGSGELKIEVGGRTAIWKVEELRRVWWNAIGRLMGEEAVEVL
jgi:hypothetical protein